MLPGRRRVDVVAADAERGRRILQKRRLLARVRSMTGGALPGGGRGVRMIQIQLLRDRFVAPGAKLPGGAREQAGLRPGVGQMTGEAGTFLAQCAVTHRKIELFLDVVVTRETEAGTRFPEQASVAGGVRVVTGGAPVLFHRAVNDLATELHGHLPVTSKT
jgi:hypothetical protein